MRPAASGLGAVLIVVGAGCALSEPDASSEAALVECFLADYALGPTFDSPETAVADALETEAAIGPMPGSVDQYERIERSEDRVDLEFRESDDNYVTWSTTQDEEGLWSVVSLSACLPNGT
jgi:hypothetical protein